MRSNEILMILFSYAVNYPVLRDWCKNLFKPIGLLFAEPSLAQKFCLLLSTKPVIIQESDSHSFASRILMKSNSEAVCLICRSDKGYQDKNTRNNLKVMFSVAETGLIGGRSTGCAPFMIFYNYIPENLKQGVFAVHIEESVSFEGADSLHELIPSVEDLSYIKAEIESFDEDDALPLKAATAFLKPKLMKSGEENLYLELLKTCEKIARMAETYAEEDQVVNLVETVFINYYTDYHPIVLMLDTLVATSTDEIEKALVFSGDKLYIREAHFKIVMADLIKIFGVDALKEKLVREEVISGTIGAYTKRIGIKLSDRMEVVRMLEFNLCLLPKFKSFILERS